jgi:murein DD-endopeptidase MepM/ murein hydrolase activator NlpD
MARPLSRERSVAAVILAVALAAAGCADLDPVAGPSGSGGSGKLSDEGYAAPVEVQPLESPGVPVYAEVASGDTLESISRRMAGEEWVRWRDALSAELDARRLMPGTVFDGRIAGDGRLERLRVMLDRRTEVFLELDGEEIRVDRVVRPLEHRLLRVEGILDSSLFAAVTEAGAEPELAVRVAEIFQWDIDFFRDIRKGDSFIVLVDQLSIDSEPFGYGQVFAARFICQGRQHHAVLYQNEDERLGYYDLEGRPLRKQFLRSPLKLSRITSRFSMRRFHPVHKRYMPHYGVDYGAPIGTPVHVTSDGAVSFVGRNGGAGRMVSVRHPNGYETSYLHLRSYGSGISRGARVRQGQVIGYVGTSGTSSGPHLDYRVRLNGRWVNPLSIASPPAEPLEATSLEGFLEHTIALVQVLDGHEAPDGAGC